MILKLILFVLLHNEILDGQSCTIKDQKPQEIRLNEDNPISFTYSVRPNSWPSVSLNNFNLMLNYR